MSRIYLRLRLAALLTFVLAVAFFANADDQQTGEWAVMNDGTPAKVGQTTQDHIFVRGSYNDLGQMEVYDNVVSFKSDALQTVWLWLDDDKIYLNERVQALPPTLIEDNGDPYNEITYNSCQLTIYLPDGIQMVKCENEEGDEISFVQGGRMPNSAIFKFAADSATKMIDGIVYRPYTLLISNLELNGTHFSSRNAQAYQNNGAMKKDDAPLVGIFLKNTNQDVPEGPLADMIIANQEFCMIEPLVVEPKWEPNDYRFIYGEGGNNQTQRYQLYNRVALYGSKGFGNSILVDQLSLDYSSKVMKVGESFQLTARVLPDDATDKTLTWTSSNPNVATVNSEGVVTAVAAGSATITATTNDGSNLSASCTVAVYVQASAISLNTNNLTLGVDETSQLVAYIYPSNTTNKTVTWKSSDTSIARVSNNGLVTAVSPGSVTITATTTDGSNLSATCSVTVTERLATSISLNTTTLSLSVNQTSQLTATVLPENASDRSVTWTTNNPNVATVNSEGVVTAVAAGSATITATTNDGSNLSASCAVSVYVPASAISLNTNSLTLEIDETSQLVAYIYPSNTTNKTVTWRSSDTSIARVSNNGLVTAVSPGSVTITATTTDGSNLSATCSVTVTGRLATSISLNTTTLSLSVNQTSQLTATVLPENASDRSVTWTTNNPNVATVNSEGVVTAVAAGSATITATTNDGSNLSASCAVSVYVPASAISLNTNSLTLEVDETSQLVAYIYPSNTTNKNVTWRSSNTSIARVSNNGLVTAVAPGSVTITATTTDGTNLSATCSVTVTERLATSISLNTYSLSLYVNQMSQLTATVYPSDVANNTVSWKSSDTSVATVTSNGLVKAIAPGLATVTATTTDGSNLSASCNVTVSIIPVTSISLDKTSITLDIEESYKLEVSITPSNATYKTVTWASSNTSVATVSNNGTITPVAPGNATITASTTDGTNLSATCQVTVIKRVKAITLDKNSLTLIIPETAQLTASFTPSDATNKELRWFSGNTAVATVDNNGVVTPVAVGVATIQATTTDGSNLSAYCVVFVKEQLVTSLTLNESKVVVHIGETSRLIADIAPENASNKTLAWSSMNPDIASVDNNGWITGMSAGTTFVTASTTDGSNLSAVCEVEVISGYFISLDTLSHVRGEAAQVADLAVSLANENPVSAIRFDVTLPAGVTISLKNGKPDVWLDEARLTPAHSIIANRLSSGKYRVIVSSTGSQSLLGNAGKLVHMNVLLPQLHESGDQSINLSSIIVSESDGTRHNLDDASSLVHFYYMVGDADANAMVDIADHNATASRILGKTPSPFYSDAADVDESTSLDVIDLVGIANIALEIQPMTIRQVPAMGSTENRLFCDQLRLNDDGEAVVSVGMDCGFSFAGFQMDMALPRGLTLTSAALVDQASVFGLATEAMPDGKIRILGTSFSAAEVSGRCPQLLRLKVKADRSYLQGSNIEFTDILFAERDLTRHDFEGSSIEYVEPSTVYELMAEAKIYVQEGNIIVETPVSGTVRLIAADGRMVERQAHVGRNVYPVNATGIFIIHFNGKTIKVRL